MFGLRKMSASVAAIGWLCVWLVTSASAKPEYARREGVACDYCHLSGSPGSVDQFTGRRQSLDRNPRGIFYGTHNHSFAGYVEPAAPRLALPTFRFAWKEDFKTLPRRIAVADVTGDHKPRLITLTEKPDEKNASTLEIRRWDGKAFTTEFTGEVHTAADRLAVGRFAGPDKPAVIVTPDALWAWDGTTYTRRQAAAPIAIVGVSRLRDGQERVLVAPTSNSLLAYKVNLASIKKDDWLIDPIKAPSPPENVWGDMHSSPEFLAAMGIPESLGSGGLYGIWYLKKFNVYYIYQIKLNRDFDIAADPQNPGKPKITYKNPMYYVSVRDTTKGDEVWTSPRLPGEGLDLAVDDPRGAGKPGLLVLFNGSIGPDGKLGKGRTLAFFAMD